MIDGKPATGKPPRHHRKRGIARRLRELLTNSWIADRWWGLRETLYNWWHPASKGGYAGYGYGGPRENRMSRGGRRLRRRIVDSVPSQFLRSMVWRLHDWWYPQRKDGAPHYGYDGDPRRSRFAIAARRLRRRWAGSVPGRWYAAAADRLYSWWYPVAPGHDPYPNYYGPRRKSRPVLAWFGFRRRVRKSWLGKRCGALLDRTYAWWYPPVPASEARYAYYTPRVSRPVQALRRWNRRFRKTWVGREFGWLLDEVGDLFYFLEHEVADVLSWRRMQKWLWRKESIAVLVLLTFAVVGWSRFAHPRYRQFLEQRFARQAEQFLARRDFARAYLRARQVMDINPTNAAACRVNADLADWANSPFALYWRQRSASLDPTLTNRLALASTALRAEGFPYATATKTLEGIEPQLRNSANFHLVAGALAVKLNKLDEAEQHYAKARELQPDNPVTQMSLAVVQLQSRDSKAVTDSRITLELLNADGKLGILPLRSLVAESVAARDFARAERLSNQVLTNAQSSFADRMLHLSILRAARQTNFLTFLKDLQHQAVQEPVYVGELASWMNQSGFAGEALTWMRELPQQVSSHGLVPLAFADSYVALKKWKDLETYLEGEHWIGQDHIRIALLALALRNESGKQAMAFAWDRAMRLASESPASLNMLAQLALSWGWTPEAEQVLWHATVKFPTQSWPLTSLQKLCSARRDTQGLRRVYQTLLQRNPKDGLARNNCAMLSLLCGKDLAAAHSDAAQLYTAEPKNPTFASTYAFSLYLQGRSKEGIEVLRSLKPEELANPAVSVYYGVLLTADGQGGAARDYLNKSEKAFLLPEELALVNSAKSKPN
jgi:Flp pilus assembly protein TadD